MVKDMQAKITSVYDEGALEGTPLIGAKGFAVLIEIGGKKVLFDTGRRGRYLLHNMMFLDVKLEEITELVISHGHTSHTGGLYDLLKGRETSVEIYAPSSALYAGKLLGPKGISIPEEFSGKAVIHEVSDWTELAGKLFVSCPIGIGGGLTESFIVILSRKGPVVISACSHAGVDEIMESVKKRFGEYPVKYIGGLHIGKKEKEKANRAAAVFSDKGCTDLYLNHCTDTNGITSIRAAIGLETVKNFYVGSVLSVDV